MTCLTSLTIDCNSLKLLRTEALFYVNCVQNCYVVLLEQMCNHFKTKD